MHNGRAGTFTVAAATNGAGFAFGRADDVPGSRHLLGSVQSGGDALVRLNDAFAPDPVFVDVPAGVTGRGARCSSCTGATRARPPSRALAVRAGEGATVSVVEVFAGAEGATARWSSR